MPEAWAMNFLKTLSSRTIRSSESTAKCGGFLQFAICNYPLVPKHCSKDLASVGKMRG
jgi:hypothetical protein